jgi:hypothetical protein
MPQRQQRRRLEVEHDQIGVLPQRDAADLLRLIDRAGGAEGRKINA